MWTKVLKTCSLSALLIASQSSLARAQQTEIAYLTASSGSSHSDLSQMSYEVPLAATVINRLLLRAPQKHHADPAALKPSLKERLQFDVQDTVFYGIFGREQSTSQDIATRAHMSPTKFGFGIERPIDRGLALRFEVLQGSPDDSKGSNPLRNATAALRLRLSF